jgi:hypothetical protein
VTDPTSLYREAPAEQMEAATGSSGPPSTWGDRCVDADSAVFWNTCLISGPHSSACSMVVLSMVLLAVTVLDRDLNAPRSRGRVDMGAPWMT